MNQEDIFNNIQKYLFKAQTILAELLKNNLPKKWNLLYINKLHENQLKYVHPNFLTNKDIEKHDLQTLIKVTTILWDQIQKADNSCKDYEIKTIKQLKVVRNNWSHCPTKIYHKRIILNDLYTLFTFFMHRGYNDEAQAISNMIAEIQNSPLNSQFNKSNTNFNSHDNKQNNTNNTKQNSKNTQENKEKSEDKEKNDDANGCLGLIVIFFILYWIFK